MDKLLTKIDKAFNRAFCPLPWMHLMVHPNGTVSPCCLNREYVFGDLKQSNLGDILNSDKAKSFRKEMLEAGMPKSCANCINIEKVGNHSYRKDIIEKYGNKFLETIKVESDGSSNNNFFYLDLRFSNVCNLRCRMCGPWDSTAWDAEATEMGFDKVGKTKAFENIEDLLKVLATNLDSLDEIYLAGGEPLLMNEQKTLLEFLIDKKHTDITLRYNTNFSIPSKMLDQYIELWNSFSRVTLNVSIDGEKDTLEYIRKDASWDLIISNLERVKPYGNITVFPIITTQWLNIYNIPDMHLNLILRGLVSPGQIFFNILQFPNYMSAQVLPLNIKLKVEKKWNKYIEKLKTFPMSEYAVSQAQSVITFMNQSDQSQLLEAARANALKFDQMRNENLSSITKWMQEE